MIFRYADPARDEEAYYTAKTAAQYQWENENYVGKCELCGKPMFKGAWEYEEEVVDDLDYANGYVHLRCRSNREEELEELEAERLEEAREAFDDMMGHPMEALERVAI